MTVLQLYHGTNQRFKQFDPRKARVQNDLYGGDGIYLTDSKEIAYGYAKSMSKQYGGEKIVYLVSATFHKIFDVDHKFTGTELTKFFDAKDVEQFARGARLLFISPGKDKYSILASLSSGNMVLTGDQVFRGLSFGMINTAAAREKLKHLGYDALRYNGGLMDITRTQALHHVYIPYKTESVKILKTSTFTPKKSLGEWYKINKSDE